MKKTDTFYKVVTIIFIAALLSLYPITAFAQGEATTGSPAGDLLMSVLKIALAGVSILGSILVSKAITYFEKKTKIDIPAATEKMLFDLADQAVGLAHEKAHQAL